MTKLTGRSNKNLENNLKSKKIVACEAILFGIVVMVVILLLLNPHLYPYQFKKYERGIYDCKHFSSDVGLKVEEKYPDKEVWVIGGWINDLPHAWLSVDDAWYETVIATYWVPKRTIGIGNIVLLNYTAEWRIKPEDYRKFLDGEKDFKVMEWI